MELEFGIKGRVPQMALKQEDIFDKTLIKIKNFALVIAGTMNVFCLLYTSPSPRDRG